MQIKTKHYLTMLVMAGISIAAFPANAATVYTAGDVLLGFRSPTLNSSVVTVNITGTGSPYANSMALRDAVGDTGTTLININAALSQAFGNDWATAATDLTWGLVSVRDNVSGNPTVDGDTARTLYLSRAHSAQSTTGLEDGTDRTFMSGSTAVGVTANAVAGFQSSFQGFAGTGATELFNSGNAVVFPSSTTSTWEDYATAGSDFSSGANLEGSVNTAFGRVLDLYSILGSTAGGARVGVWEGTVSLGTDGTVSFANGVAAVPEPSRALLAFAGMGALLFRRRRA